MDVLAFLKEADAELGETAVNRAFKLLKAFRKNGGVVRKRRAISRAVVAAKVEKQEGRCARCGRKFTKANPATGDHTLAHNRGGDETEDNVRALCKRCNSQKSDRTLLEDSKHTGQTILDQIS
jgi:5-methylcytosine-specific restriction endonuclease McrA